MLKRNEHSNSRIAAIGVLLAMASRLGRAVFLAELRAMLEIRVDILGFQQATNWTTGACGAQSA